jgi:hypothetical protein
MPKTQFWAVLGTSFPTIIFIYFGGCWTNKKPPVWVTGGEASQNEMEIEF